MCVAGHQNCEAFLSTLENKQTAKIFCMQGLKAQGSPGKIIVALVLPGLQRNARAAKKPSAEKRFWFLLSLQKGQALAAIERQEYCTNSCVSFFENHRTCFLLLQSRYTIGFILRGLVLSTLRLRS